MRVSDGRVALRWSIGSNLVARNGCKAASTTWLDAGFDTVVAAALERAIVDKESELLMKSCASADLF